MRNDNWKVNVENGAAGDWGGQSNWQENMCFWTDGRAVEMDWQRFYWDYRTNAGTQPTHYEIFYHIQHTMDEYGWDHATTWDVLRQRIGEAGQGSFLTRWNDVGSYNGVDQ